MSNSPYKEKSMTSWLTLIFIEFILFVFFLFLHINIGLKDTWLMPGAKTPKGHYVLRERCSGLEAGTQTMVGFPTMEACELP